MKTSLFVVVVHFLPKKRLPKWLRHDYDYDDDQQDGHKLDRIYNNSLFIFKQSKLLFYFVVVVVQLARIKTLSKNYF